jgi:predicted deacylase
LTNKYTLQYMKNFKVALLALVVLITAQTISGQQIKENSGNNDEVYFSFPIHSKSEISSITKQISIDNVRHDTVWAYASMKQFLTFSKLGYNITLLPHPGDAPGVVMKDHFTINSPSTNAWNVYPTYSGYETLMSDFQTLYPTICKTQTIATLASGRKLIVVKISDNVATDEAEPEFLYTSSIHGDETTGYVMLLHLIDYLLSNYGTNSEATDLVNGMEIYICPLANPDGTYYGGDNTVLGSRRGNANNVDMNRNYPDPQDGDHPDGYSWQPETVAFMDFATQHHFIAATNFHGGAEVVNYPWDTWATLSADDAWWQYVSHEYADTAKSHASSLGNTTYMTSVTSTGVTDGYAWYEVNGGRQDYMNYWHHCREYTIEISNTKTVAAAQLPTYWEYNWRSLILFLKETRYGLHGIITDQATGSPVAAKVFISGHDLNNSEVYSSANPGDYHRLLIAGTYTLTISATGYQTKTIPGVIITNHSTTNLDIQLSRLASVTTMAATSVTTSSAVLYGTVNPNGIAATYHFEWGTTTSYGNSTPTLSAGSGVLDVLVNASISGLASGTLYHFRIVATNSNGTNNGNDLTFTTLCGSITSFPWNEGFENAGVIPNCWTQERVASSGIDFTFITGNGTGYPAAAHGGTYNACLKDASTADNKTKLITPSINLTSLGSPVLKFYHTQSVWSGRQDQLIVYYRTSLTGTWTTLVTYTASITAWTLETISLPSASSDYYLAFEGNAKYGRGVCIDDVSITGTVTPTLTVTPSDQPVTAAAGSTSFTATTGSAWTATTPQTWCTVTPSGTGTGTIVATYSLNTTPSSRVASITVTVSGVTPVVVTVTQAAPTLSVSPADRPVTADAGSTTFNVTSNSAWSVSSNQTWCTVTPSGTGTGIITANYTANTLLSPRAANITVTVAGATPVIVTVTQAAFVPTLSVTPADQPVTDVAGNTSFTVTSNTTWAASSDQTWCTVTPSGSGNGTITATYADNFTLFPRIANVTVNVTGLAPVVVTVTQAAAPAPEYNYTIANDVQTSDKTLEFDLYLLDTQPSVPLELSIIQAGILVNNAIAGSGTITASIISGSSELVTAQQPTVITWATGTPNACIKIAPKAGPGCGTGTIISTTGLGTRICRVRITNSIPFAAGTQANMAFNFTLVPYATRVFQYSGTPCANNVITSTLTNCFSLASNPVLNGPPSLSVSPSNQSVSSPAGTVPFDVTSNTSWTASSNQSWCTVTSSSFGNGTITANYSENTNPSPRVANVTVTVTGLTPAVVTVTQDGTSIKTVNLSVLLQGLYTGLSTMHPAMNESGPHWDPTIADKLTIELHDGSNYSTIVYTASNVSLYTNGTASFTTPSTYNGNYYVTIRNRNHILTTTALPVSFSSSVINYDFDALAKAYGDNLALLIDGRYVIYAGDENQDGNVDGYDLAEIGNMVDAFASGYIKEDINGDGTMDGYDLAISGNNTDGFVGSITP